MQTKLTKHWRRRAVVRVGFLLPLLVAVGACTQETQNKFGRAVQNWTGMDPGERIDVVPRRGRGG